VVHVPRQQARTPLDEMTPLPVRTRERKVSDEARGTRVVLHDGLGDARRARMRG
jgi:hypothetical protein